MLPTYGEKGGSVQPKEHCVWLYYAGGGGASRAGNLIKVEERGICEILKENLKEEWVVI